MRRADLALLMALATIPSLTSACGGDDESVLPAGGTTAVGGGGAGGGGGVWQAGREILRIDLESTSSSDQQNVPVSFGQVFAPGEVPAGTFVGATWGGDESAGLQVDAKATHADGSLRHGVLTLVVPSLAGSATRELVLVTAEQPASGDPVILETLLATDFDAVVTATVGSADYRASARNLLAAATPEAWLQGPVATEWLVAGPLVDSATAAHPHLLGALRRASPRSHVSRASGRHRREHLDLRGQSAELRLRRHRRGGRAASI